MNSADEVDSRQIEIYHWGQTATSCSSPFIAMITISSNQNVEVFRTSPNLLNIIYIGLNNAVDIRCSRQEINEGLPHAQRRFRSEPDGLINLVRAGRANE